jgi:hypothetical protein
MLTACTTAIGRSRSALARADRDAHGRDPRGWRGDLEGHACRPGDDDAADEAGEAPPADRQRGQAGAAIPSAHHGGASKVRPARAFAAVSCWVGARGRRLRRLGGDGSHERPKRSIGSQTPSPRSKLDRICRLIAVLVACGLAPALRTKWRRARRRRRAETRKMVGQRLDTGGSGGMQPPAEPINDASPQTRTGLAGGNPAQTP